MELRVAPATEVAFSAALGRAPFSSGCWPVAHEPTQTSGSAGRQCSAGAGRARGRQPGSLARLGGAAALTSGAWSRARGAARRAGPRQAGTGAVRCRCAGEGAAVAPAEEAAAPAAPEAAAAAVPAEDGAPTGDGRRQRVLSGVQPTGDLHLGNYFGAISQWVRMQDDYDCFFCIVDLHAITVPHNPKELRKATLSTAAAYLASGIDPEKSTVFVQSAVPQHAQLSWLLNTQTPMSWLQQMTQYKEKAVKFQRAVGAGLFAYPVLMAADILLYQTDKVPVGEDQMEHLFLARDIAERMNRDYKKTAPKKRRLFRVPDALVGKQGARVMGLSDGTNKMSKSDPNPDSRITITDDPSTIKRKIKRCKTDSIVGLELANPERPEAANLLKLYALARGVVPEVVAEECVGDNWGVFKGKLTDALVEYLAPMQAEYKRIMEDPAFLKATLDKGRLQAMEVAGQTLSNVEIAMGFGY